ncbi:kallikrein-7-like [Myotis daubentonii]|uniref:kallikrein-7-like n=1 Tax=Myotis daubentonii TaxID=98922 RepID=UPI0028733520|nr:kallikrein-7-like [Myotis daubentonii]XP_059521465.1 kallikrein-7-like [Myotis daubentonii]
MAGPLLQPLLLLLLSFALGSAGQEGLHPAQDTGERIINGVSCPRGSHPWQVALYDNDEFHCAGVLLNQQWVLTVAHCRLSEYIVQMGSDLLVDGNVQRIWATQYFVHPRYNNSNYNHDIMLVKLSSPATLSPTVSTIDLPSSCKDPGTSCTVSGWGVTTGHAAATNPSELMCSNVNIISYQECQQSYQNLLKKYMLCAVPPDGLSNSCTGDSGNPLVCEGSLQGLVSSGYFPCILPFAPVTYTRLCMYRKWVYKTMKANS